MYNVIQFIFAARRITKRIKSRCRTHLSANLCAIDLLHQHVYDSKLFCGNLQMMTALNCTGFKKIQSPCQNIHEFATLRLKWFSYKMYHLAMLNEKLQKRYLQSDRFRERYPSFEEFITEYANLCKNKFDRPDLVSSHF